jgi:hypothetical protein
MAPPDAIRPGIQTPAIHSRDVNPRCELVTVAAKMGATRNDGIFAALILAEEPRRRCEPVHIH